jgi:hypothetical protein
MQSIAQKSDNNRLWERIETVELPDQLSLIYSILDNN